MVASEPVMDRFGPRSMPIGSAWTLLPSSPRRWLRDLQREGSAGQPEGKEAQQKQKERAAADPVDLWDATRPDEHEKDAERDDRDEQDMREHRRDHLRRYGFLSEGPDLPDRKISRQEPKATIKLRLKSGVQYGGYITDRSG